MATPDTWGTPTAGTVTAAAGFLSYAGGYWFALTYTTTADTTPVLRYTADPTGTWATATLPAAPATYNLIVGLPFRHGVVYGNGQYAFGLGYKDATPTGAKAYSFSATDPSGTWTRTQIGTSTELDLADYVYVGGTLAAVGRGVTTNNPWIAYATAADGTWTVNNTQATTGYDPAADWRIEGIDHDGTRWVTVATGPGTDGARYSTSLTSSWGTASGFPTVLGTQKQLRYESDASLWTVADKLNFSYYYASDPTGTWGTVGSALTGMTDQVQALTYGADYWVAAGADHPGSWDVPRLAYLSGASPDSGTYTGITNPFTSRPSNNESAYDVLWANNYAVALSRFWGELRYCYLPSATPPSTRYRAIGGNLRLRQRQTPRIT